jgi:putative ABC transport system substrate-binding protein
LLVPPAHEGEIGASLRRRALLAGSLGLLATPIMTRAQAPTNTPRIGVLSLSSPADVAGWHQAFRQGLADLGWLEGKNVAIEFRYAEGRTERLDDLAADLVRLKVDVIVTGLNTDAQAAQKATRTIPIVMAFPGDPVGTGLIASLARPGDNITGLTSITPELAGKRLELLKEIVPKLSHVAVLWNPRGRISALSWKEIQRPARDLSVELHSLEVRASSELDRAVADAVRVRADALVVMPDPVFVTNLRRIAGLAARSRLPSIYNLRDFVAVGGLASYGPDPSDLFRRAATYVDKILKGARPADLPVEQPTKFDLAINVKTAKALGLTIPPALLARADEIIR